VCVPGTTPRPHNPPGHHQLANAETIFGVWLVNYKLLIKLRSLVNNVRLIEQIGSLTHTSQCSIFKDFYYKTLTRV
jgi:hypothetical protein